MSKQSSRGAAWNKTRLFVLDRDGWVCAYCNRDADTVDHVLAKNNGGTDDVSNLVAACRECNGRLQDRSLVRTTWVNRRWLDGV